MTESRKDTLEFNIPKWINQLLRIKLLFSSESASYYQGVDLETELNQFFSHENALFSLCTRFNQSNILHTLFKFSLNVSLEKTSKKIYIFLPHKLPEKYGKKLPNSKEALERIIQENKNGNFYLDSVSKYGIQQNAYLTQRILNFLANHPNILFSMLLEKDKNESAPLHTLLKAKDNLSHTKEIFIHITKIIKSFPEENKFAILFLEDKRQRLFLHFLYRNHQIALKDLTSTFDENALVRAFQKQDGMQWKSTFHIACNTQTLNEVEELFFLMLRKNQKSIFFTTTISNATPIHSFLKNINIEYKTATILDYFNQDEFNTLLAIKTKTNNSLLPMCISHNQDNFIKIIAERAHPTILMDALTHKNSLHLNALNIAAQHANAETFRLTIQLYRPFLGALWALLIESPEPIKSNNLQINYIRNCIFDVTEDTLYPQWYELHLIMRELIHVHPNNTSDDQRIREFVDACIFIILGNQLSEPTQLYSHTFFNPKKSLSLEKRLYGITPQAIQLFITHAVSFLLNYNHDNKNFITLLWNQYQSRMESLSQPLPPAFELHPIYDGEIEARLKKCYSDENDLKKTEIELGLFNRPPPINTTKTAKNVLDQRKEICTLRERAIQQRKEQISLYLNQYMNPTYISRSKN